MIAGKETKEHLLEVLGLLKATITNDPQVKFFIDLIFFYKFERWNTFSGL